MEIEIILNPDDFQEIGVLALASAMNETLAFIQKASSDKAYATEHVLRPLAAARPIELQIVGERPHTLELRPTAGIEVRYHGPRVIFQAGIKQEAKK